MRLSRREFQGLVRKAVQDLPPQFRSALENVAVLLEDWPTGDDLEAVGAEGRGQLFGLYNGVPLPEREGGPPPWPDTITLFQRPIESACVSRHQVVREVRDTVLHEVGHYLGLHEDDLDRLGYG